MEEFIKFLNAFEYQRATDMSEEQYDIISLIKSFSELDTKEAAIELFEEHFTEISKLDLD